MKRHLRCAVLLPLLLALAAPAAAQQGVRQTQEGIILNFQDVDLAYVISALSQAANINVTYLDLPQKLVTVRTPQPVTAEEIATLIRNLARANGVQITETPGTMLLQGSSGEEQVPRQLYIQRLRHARAPVLAQTLQALFGGGTTVRGTNAAQAAATLSQQLRQMQIEAAQLRAQGQPVPQEFTIQSGFAGDLLAPVTIVPDEVTNSLLVRASAQDWIVIQQAIQSLDLRPLSVVIEVIIAEVRRTDELNVGVSFSAVDDDGAATLFGVTPDDDTARPGDFSLRFIRAGNIDVDATLSALAATGKVRILSRPLVQAQNNQEARILVGSQRPFVAVQRSLPTSEVAFDQVVQYRDVGTSLTILPTINDDGYVNLAVTQEVSSATNETQFDAPVISTREATTQILARNGQTVVVGGLVDRQRDRVRSGIPFLKDIPILGYLFGTTREFDANSELFLFLTPYIVTNDEDADRLLRDLESKAELLEDVAPIQTMLPTVIRTIPDTSRIRPDTIRDGGR